MELILYLMALLVCCTGLYAGMALAYIAPEELSSGRKYLRVLQLILGMGSVGYGVYLFSHSALAVAAALAIWLWLVLRKVSESFNYAVLGIVFCIASLSAALFPIQATLIFFYGFPTGTLLAAKFQKRKSAGLAVCLAQVLAWFVALAIAGLLVQNLIK